jgi:methyl-accepting chemotaxis protein
LISARGDILYTVAKEIDFATNLKTGPYRKSPLAEVFRRVMTAPNDEVDFSDFARYRPSNDEPAAFAAYAVRKGDEVVGVFAVQIPAEPLNELMQFTHNMGQTGETYLVGPDGLMRSQSRFIKEPTLLRTKVENASVRDGLKSESGAHIVPDYRGIPVLSVYSPVDVGGRNGCLSPRSTKPKSYAKTSHGSCFSWRPLPDWRQPGLRLPCTSSPPASVDRKSNRPRRVDQGTMTTRKRALPLSMRS